MKSSIPTPGTVAKKNELSIPNFLNCDSVHVWNASYFCYKTQETFRLAFYYGGRGIIIKHGTLKALLQQLSYGQHHKRINTVS